MSAIEQLKELRDRIRRSLDEIERGEGALRFLTLREINERRRILEQVEADIREFDKD